MKLTIGLFAEGTTDERFLPTIIQRTFEEVGAEFERGPQLDVLPLVIVRGEGDSFPQQLLDAAKRAAVNGVQMLCVHVDSDRFTLPEIDEFKLTPGFAEVAGCTDGRACQQLVPLVPVRAMEAWMLADKDLLRELIGTPLSPAKLGLGRAPEKYPRPKDDIEKALSIAHAGKKRPPAISDLYAPMSDQLRLDKLDALDSYKTFREAVRTALEQLGCLR